MGSVIYMDITSAYTDLHDLHQHLVRSRLRNRNLPKRDLLRGSHHFLQHHLIHGRLLFKKYFIKWFNYVSEYMPVNVLQQSANCQKTPAGF